MPAVDLDRGCVIRFHPSGYRIAMYKDSPGRYFDGRGEAVAAELAKQAGFDVDALDVERRKQERMAQYKAQVEEEFATAEQEAEAVLRAEGASAKHIGKGKYAIVDDNGTRLTTKPLTKQEAETLIADMKGGFDHGTS